MNDGTDDTKSKGTTWLSLQTIQDAIEWSYTRVLDGVPGTTDFETFVASYLRDGKDPEGAIDEMINWQTGNAGVAGFLSGVGGALTLPVSIPANLASSLFFQLRLAAGVAKIRGYDPRSDQAKSMAIACLVGSSAVKTLQSAGVVIGSKLAHQAIGSISREVIVKINQAVGFRMLTKFGHTGAINLGNLIPFVGGFISAAFDVAAIRGVGGAAKSVFARYEDDIGG